MSEKVNDIVQALKNADCGQDIYNALLHVPAKNLKDMQKMIEYILKKKDEMKYSHFIIELINEEI